LPARLGRGYPDTGRPRCCWDAGGNNRDVRGQSWL